MSSFLSLIRENDFSATSSEYVLEMRGISKRFPGVNALSNVNFTLRRGSVHGIIGENGAGKSTLMRILAGAYVADEGEVIVEGGLVPGIIDPRNRA
jgi:ABC-type sugar transport system ATPase subunit